MLDYVAMDVKASPENYSKVAGLQGMDVERVGRSVKLLKESGIDYEFRTTVVKGLHSIEEFEKIGRWLSGARAYYLQAYRENENVLCPGYEAFSGEDMEAMAAFAHRYIDRVMLRGVE